MTHLDDKWIRLAIQFWIFSHFDGTPFDNAASQKHLHGQRHSWVRMYHVTHRVSDPQQRCTHTPLPCPCVYLSHQLGLPTVGNVILADISVKPVTEIQEAVIEGDQDIGDETYGRVLR